MIVMFILIACITETSELLLPDIKRSDKDSNKRIPVQLKIGSISSAHWDC
jgi:hypothetical protein